MSKENYDVKLDSFLEGKLESLSQKKNISQDFPSQGGCRWDVYKSIKQSLWEKYYRDVDAALTASEGGAYTHHDESHVNDVIETAGLILGANSTGSDTPAVDDLKPYEVFVLLIACLVHDVGNVKGRSGHSKRAIKVLKEVAGGKLPQMESQMIGNIARAHGGKCNDDSKDTIRGFITEREMSSGKTKVRAWTIAATLRLADELAETHQRASSRPVESSKFPNLYCRRVVCSVDYIGREIKLKYNVFDDENALLGVNEDGEVMHFIDYIKGRIKKTDLERRYCNQFLQGFASYESLKIHIEFFEDDDKWREDVTFELFETGYPSDNGIELSIPSGEELKKSYKKHKGAGND